MKLRAGSALWLLRHELRLALFRLGKPVGAKGKAGAKKKKWFRKAVAIDGASATVDADAASQVPVKAVRRGPGTSGLIFLAVVLIALQGLAWLIAPIFMGHADGNPLFPIGLTVLCALVFSMMLSQGLRASVEVLFERGDMDLLLSSPLPSRSIFIVRLAGVVISSATLYLFLFGVMANAGLLRGHPRWLAIYPMILGAAALAGSLSMLLTLALVRLMGVRRTRVTAQVLGALVGAAFFLITQVFANSRGAAQNWLGEWISAQTAANATFGPSSLAWLPGRAVMGAPLPLLGVVALGAIAFWFTAHFTHGFFVHGVQQAVSLVRNAAPPRAGVRYRFGRSLGMTVLLKEWRMIGRDPQLISQVLLQLLYMLPACFLLFKATNAVPGIGASLTFLLTSLTTALAWLSIAAEDAPDLLRSSPASNGTVARAKLAAAILPGMFLVAAPLLWLASRKPLAALVLALCMLGASASSATVVRWGARPAPRGEFQRRAAGGMTSHFIELLGAVCWTGLAWIGLSLTQPSPYRAWLWGAGAALLLLLSLLLFAARLRRLPAV